VAKRIGKPSAIKRRKMITVTGLYSQFEKACAALEALPSGAADDHPKQWNRAIDRCVTLAKQIVRTPAWSVPELRMKIRAAIWDENGRLYALDAHLPQVPPMDGNWLATDCILEALDHDLRSAKIFHKVDLELPRRA
jgi:hypothetical protein